MEEEETAGGESVGDQGVERVVGVGGWVDGWRREAGFGEGEGEGGGLGGGRGGGGGGWVGGLVLGFEHGPKEEFVGGGVGG